MALHEIYTAQDLKDFRDLTNLGYTYINAKLMNDIYLAGNDSDQWIPIASQASRQWPEYTGTFDGNGYKISGLYINRSTILDEYGEPDYDIDDCAFIGQLADEGIVKNLTLEGYILGGWWSVAGFVGELYGGKIINCINRVTITGPEDGDTLGGFAGCCGWGNSISRNSEIINCINDANVGIEMGSGTFGGIIGFGNGCSITNCINNGNVFGGSYAVAGIAGDYNSANIINCVNNGDITGTDEDVSGIANYLNADTGDTISNCVNTGTITGVNYVAGITDRIRGDAQIKNCVNEGNIICSGDNYGAITSELNIPITTTYDDDFSASFILNDGNIDMGTVYPNYKHYYEDVEPSGTVYEIYTAQDLKDFRDLVNSDSTASAKLMNDIDLAGNDSDQWISINRYGSFGWPWGGTFDGNGHTVSGIYINSTNRDFWPDAFIGVATDGAVIKNLTVNGVITSNRTGYNGGILAVGCGCKIINCRNEIYLNFTNTLPGVNNLPGVGGIAGYLGHGVSNRALLPLVVNCNNYNQITSNGIKVGGIVGEVGVSDTNIINCYNDSNVSGKDYAAGIVGYGTCNIYNCVNRGHIVATGTASTGSVAGIAYTGHAYNCFNNTWITGTKYTGGILSYGGTAVNCVNNGIIEALNTSSDWGYGSIFGDNTNVDVSTTRNNYYRSDSSDRAYTDNTLSTYVTSSSGIIDICTDFTFPAVSCLLDNETSTIYPEFYNRDISNVTLDGRIIDADYPQNNYYLDTSCDRAWLDKNDNYSVVISFL